MRQMRSFTRVLSSPVCIPGRDVAPVVAAPLPISNRMYREGPLTTTTAGGIVPETLVKRAKPPFGLNKCAFHLIDQRVHLIFSKRSIAVQMH